MYVYVHIFHWSKLQKGFYFCHQQSRNLRLLFPPEIQPEIVVEKKNWCTGGAQMHSGEKSTPR